MKKFTLLFSFLLILRSCILQPETTFPLRVKNNSHHHFGLYFPSSKDGIFYPDTILPLSNKYLKNPIVFESYYFHSSNSWDYVYSQFPQDTMSVFVFHSDTLAKFSWEEVRKGYKVLVRYDLSLEDLERLNFELSYPPDNRMQGIKMYPR